MTREGVGATRIREVLPRDTRRLVAAPPEVRDEFARVGERFRSEFDPYVGPEIPRIDTYFDKHDLYRHLTVTVPYTAEGFAAARAVASETKFPMPLVLEHFNPATDFETVNGSSTAFSVPAYKLNVVTDTSEQYAKIYGEAFAKRIMSTTVAHEIAHSVFHADPKIVVEHSGRGEVETIYEEYSLSGMRHPVHRAAGSYPYVPMWAEEAFAVYISADVFKDVMPDGPGDIIQHDTWGPDAFWVDEKYLARVDAYPDYPGTIPGAVAGQTLETLDQRVPGTIDAMFGIARGKTDPEAFRANLKRKIGAELFRQMFTKQPYTTWAGINTAVRNM